MGYGKIEWRDDFNIGVESIDKAHKELFSIVGKIINLLEDDTKSQRACSEGIKFFKNYMVEHFSQEEEYMRSVKYKHYLAHKRRHDLMKCETVPALEKELIDTGYSNRAVEHFYNICIGWLTTHIIVEDQAIVRNIDVQWEFEKAHEMRGMERLFNEAIQEMFKTNVELLDEHYSGEPLDRAICMEFQFKNTNGKRCKFIFEAEERTVTGFIARMIGVPSVKINDISLIAMSETMLSAIQRVAPKANLLNNTYQLQSEQRKTASEVRDQLSSEYFRYKLLFGSECGSFAFCYTPIVDELSAQSMDSMMF